MFSEPIKMKTLSRLCHICINDGFHLRATSALFFEGSEQNGWTNSRRRYRKIDNASPTRHYVRTWPSQNNFLKFYMSWMNATTSLDTKCGLKSANKLVISHVNCYHRGNISCETSTSMNQICLKNKLDKWIVYI